MPTALLAARLLLCNIFAIAGVAKLADGEGARRALVDFGVPKILASPLGVLLPLTEVVVAMALLPSASAWWGGAAAFVLLLLFSVVLSINLLRGRRPDCRCFGQLSSNPIGWFTLIRSLTLTLLSSLLVWNGRPSAGPRVAIRLGGQGATLFSSVMGLLLLVALARIVLKMPRQQGPLLLRLEGFHTTLGRTVAAPAAQPPATHPAGLLVGTRAPRFRVEGLGGKTLTLESFLTFDKPALLVFTNPNCALCQSLMPDLALWQMEYAQTLNIVLVSQGTTEDNRAKSAAYGLRHVLLQKKREIADAYQASTYPGAVLVRSDGTIGSPLAQGGHAIRALIVLALGRDMDARTASSALTSVSDQDRNNSG